LLTGQVWVDVDTALESSGRVLVREQSHNLAAVNPITRIELRRTGESVPIRRPILNINADGTSAGTLTLEAHMTGNSGTPTDLGFEWEVRPPGRNRPDVARVVEGAGGVQPTGTAVTVEALTAGTARITGTNHNGRRRVNLSIRILFNPTADQIIPRVPRNLRVGRSASVRARVSGRDLDRTLTYALADHGGVAHATIASLDDRQRLTAVGPGTVTLVITGSGGASRSVDITISP
jgi:hypothetical protein